MPIELTRTAGKTSFMQPSAVITSIQAPTPSTLALASRATTDGFLLWVVGDRKSPRTYELESTHYLPFHEQRRLGFNLAKMLPENHYARKNLGYLAAMASGCHSIFDTDDDNQPLPGWHVRSENVTASRVIGSGWVNAYRQFSSARVWPRGFPLENLHESFAPLRLDPAFAISSPVQQSVVNGSPDVDAIWRLVEDREFEFEAAASIHLAPGTWCPFNSQSTWWFPEAYPLLYLPSYVSFRMTDIWRSFIAQRCLWELDKGVVFHGPEMYQVRNPHNLLKDFEQEVPGYLGNSRLCQALERVALERSGALHENLYKCYEALVREGFVPKQELPLARAWLADLSITRT